MPRQFLFKSHQINLSGVTDLKAPEFTCKGGRRSVDVGNRNQRDRIAGPRDRQMPRSDADGAALFNNLFAHTGIIRLDGPASFITAVDYAWTPAWFGDQLRHFTMTGDKLVIRTPEQTTPAYGPRTIVGDVLWQRE
jgi:hypothetical protein